MLPALLRIDPGDGIGLRSHPNYLSPAAKMAWGKCLLGILGFLHLQGHMEIDEA